MRSRLPRPLLRAVTAACLAVWCAVGGTFAASPPAARGQDGMVVTPEPAATRIGVEVLGDGGNAIDAAVAVALALAVTVPRAGNLGGGGFLLYRSPDGAYAALDLREVAPAALTPEHFLGPDGLPDRRRSREGGLAVGVPGTPRGLEEAHRRWGALPWKRLVRPAIRLAARGFEITPMQADSFAGRLEVLSGNDEARRIFTLDGAALPAGYRLVQPDLAATLRRIARHGAAGFHDGPVAAAIAETVQRHGGVLTRDDLGAYAPVLRTPVEGRYRGHRIVSFPPPSSGGIALLQMLAMLERFDLAESGPGSSRTVHRVAEAGRRAFADRGRWLGDPDHVEVPVDALLDPAYLRTRSESIRDDRATPSDDTGAWAPPTPASTETLHFSIVDADGGAVSMTTTLNSWYGTGIVAEGTGVLLNNEIDDFTLGAGVPDQYGLVGGAANAVAGGKRPVSSMTPTIVEAREGPPGPLLVLGSPGGSTIISTVAEVIVGIIDHDLELQAAVDAPRFHHQWKPDRISHEALAFPEDVRVALERLGHTLAAWPRPQGRVAAILRDGGGGWLGAADPRGWGSAEGFER